MEDAGSKALDHLDDFCYPKYVFWRREGVNWVKPSHPDNVSNYTWHDEVDLTLCFEDTAILYAILVIFWFFASLRFICGNGHKPSIPFNYLNIIKSILCGIIIIPALCDLVYAIVKSRTETVAHFQFLSPVILGLSMFLAGVVIIFERKAGVRSSGLMILLWMSLIAYGTLKLRTLILLAEDLEGVTYEFQFVTFCVEYFLFILQFVLSLLSEPKSPYDYFREDDREPCPEESAPFFSRITWWWQNGLFFYGFRKSLTYDDLCDLNYGDKSRAVAPKFQMHWDKELRKAGFNFGTREQNNVRIAHGRRFSPSIVWALTKAFGFTFFVAAIFKVGQDLLSFVSPQLLKLMINYVNDSNEPEWKGYFYAAMMFLAAVIQSILLHQYFHRCFVVGMRVRTAVIATVYRKALLLSNRARRTSTVGEIVNLMSVDAQRLMDLMTYFHMIWSAPLQIVLALVFLYQTMGASIFAGFVLMILLIPVNAVIAAISKKFQVKQMIKKDMRIKLVNEVLNGIKVIKLYAWEIPFKRQVMDIRDEELKVLRASAYLNAGSSFTWTCAPFMVALATFATYSLIYRNDPDNRLTADKAFVALSLFNILRFPLSMLPMLISFIVQASVSVKRLRLFLQNEELDPDSANHIEEAAMGGEESISVIDGSFTWDSPERPALSNVNVSIKPGELVAVVGHVGAGKSSLISALLGEMEKMNGHVAMRGQVAYVPQQAWIQNATVKDNILFGKTMNGMLYDRTLHTCALEPDLEILPGGDMTEIGEKGINLSGGQKQRVSLARAVYQEADIYLLDDPLSAVDSHVGKHIFDKVIGPEGMLCGKVRLLVTHGLGFLPQCDKIIVMVDGKITEVGSYAELVDQDGAFAEFLRNYASNEVNEEGDPYANEYSEYEDDVIQPLDIIHSISDDGEAPTRRKSRLKSSEGETTESSSIKPVLKRGTSRTDLKRQLSKQSSKLDDILKDAKKPNETSNLIAVERVETGNVKLSVFVTYGRACTFIMTFLVLLFNILANGASVGQNLWLAAWSNKETAALETNESTNLAEDLGVYASLGFGQAFMVLAGSFSLALGAIHASRLLHDGMLSNILRSPMSFFDTTPLGRILNRFSKDIYTIDEVIPRSLRSFIFTFFSVISTLLVIAIASPWFLAVIIPLLIFYALIQRFYVSTSRQLKRLESVTRSPIYSHFQETVTGASSIRAYRQTERFKLQSEYRVDYNQIAYYPSVCANRWLAIRLEFIGNLIILSAAMFAALQRNYPGVLGRINPGLVGLSISYALQITQSLNWVVRMTSDLESDIVAVERTKEYSETPTEAPEINPYHRPPHNWPIEGKIQFDRYSTRYRDGLDLVLKDISADVPGGQKIGIVGRTGAGKSSLTVALFRIIESAHGAILIDGLDIATIGLSDLRSRLTIIPQDPVLFSGTLRINLDPFDSHTDDEIWIALQTAHLSEYVEGLVERLEYPVAEGGENLSVGQRQLVCLARALLRKTKILVLDEATAAVDMETDDFIQKTIRKEFADCTVITIAHRLNTIMDYDKIMVLDAGRIVEFDTPNKLLSEKGVFYGMARDANLV